MLKRKSLASASFNTQSKSIHSPEGVHFLSEVRIDARTGTSVVMTRYMIVSKDMFSFVCKTDTYRAVTLGYDPLKIL
jgi:hypothetical protein